MKLESSESSIHSRLQQKTVLATKYMSEKLPLTLTASLLTIATPNVIWNIHLKLCLCRCVYCVNINTIYLTNPCSSLLLSDKSKGVTNIRIVLLGAKGSGKTSALNTILARENNPKPIRTVCCQAGQEMVLGRLVTVVDTPGWWMNYFCDESSNFDRGELALSSYFCPPGPHVFLLVIRVDRAFTETCRRAAQEHLDMIGEHIWSHVILLFSFGDWLGDTPIEQYIESEGEALRWIVERCDNKYHVLNSKMKDKEFQVRELIAKIEKIITSSDNGCYYKLERKVLEQLEGTMRREKERARERLMKKKKQRQMARVQLGELDN